MRISDWSSDVCSSDLLDINDPGEAARVPEADVAEQRGEGDYRERRVASQGIEVEGARPSPFRGDQHDERDVAQQRQHQQAGEHAHRQIPAPRSEEHTSELQSLMRISYAGICLKKQNKRKARN